MDIDEEPLAPSAKHEASAGVLGFPKEGPGRVEAEAEWRRLLKSWSRDTAKPLSTDGTRNSTVHFSQRKTFDFNEDETTLVTFIRASALNSITDASLLKRLAEACCGGLDVWFRASALAVFFCVASFSVFFQLDVAAGTAFTRQCPQELLSCHRKLLLEADECLEEKAAFENEVRPPPPVLTKSSLSAAETAQPNSQWPLLRVYGVTEAGESVLANVFGFFPYCMCEVPRQLWKTLAEIKAKGGDWQVNELTTQVSTLVEEHVRKSHAQSRGYERRVLDVRIEEKESLMNFSPSKAGQMFFKITAASPQMISSIKTFIEGGVRLSVPSGWDCSAGTQVSIPPMAYEANIPFVLRFMVDSQMTGCSWLTVKKNSFSVRPSPLKESTCQYEVDVHYSGIKAMQPTGEWQKLPPLRLLSFDIECIKIHGQGFPSADADPVIQISSLLQVHGQRGKETDASSGERKLGNVSATSSSDPDGLVSKVLFSLHECAPIAGAIVLWFEDESEMLAKWSEFVREVDPDFLTGYNCVNFDLCYLINRARALKAEGVTALSRLRSVESKVQEGRFSSRALGTHDTKEIAVEGRVQFDVLELVRREYKLKSYTLNFVSFEFLKEQKEDVHYSMIGDLFRGGPTSRRRIGVYCLKDALLPLRLLGKLLFLYNYVEMSRVTGTPVTYLLTRGQQIKVTSQLLRKCRECHYVIPTVQRVSAETDKYEGATVLEPLRGFYDRPIATLDFASLYPSIMLAHNICYSTLIPPHQESCVSEDSFSRSPSTRACFVKRSVRRGVLPVIVEELIAKRKEVRQEMKHAKSDFEKKVLNGRQLALKISANSVYGYTGATLDIALGRSVHGMHALEMFLQAGGQLPCLEVASTITSYGREMIEYTKDRVQAIFTKAKGRAKDAIVVYGDTDSVMVDFGTSSIEEAMTLGQEAASLISAEFLPPIRLEFEKVYCPFLLMNKKRYAGLLFTNPTKHDKIDSKGIEPLPPARVLRVPMALQTVRRDFSMLVQLMVDTVLNKMLIDRDVEAAKDFVRAKIADLLQNKVDLSLLVVTKSLGKTDYDTKLPHVELAKKLRKRDAGSAPQVGDRVSYVIVRGSKGQAQYERAEEPLYVLENNLPIDTQHYLDTLKGPLTRIFEGVMSNPESLFSGDHTLKKTLAVSTTGALSRFLRKGKQCSGCRAPIQHEGALCAHCKKGEAQIVIMKSLQLQQKEVEFNELWTECQRCQGSLHEDVICMNRDCPIFYRRAKTRKDVQALSEGLKRLCSNQDW